MKKVLHSFFGMLGIQRKKAKNGHAASFGHLRTSQVIEQMNELMEQKQPFLQTGYNIKSLADELSIPSYQLSALLNRQMGMNFNEYLNQYRVQHCKKLMQAGEADNLNLKGLSVMCGFNNRNTFTMAFKKFTGRTPSDYAKNYEEYVN